MTPEKAAFTGLANIYHVITGEECGHDVALGMATSAVSGLMSERDALKQRVVFLNGRLEYWFKEATKARGEVEALVSQGGQ